MNKKAVWGAAAVLVAPFMAVVLLVVIISGKVVHDRREAEKDCVTEPSAVPAGEGNGEWREPVQQNYRVTSRPGDKDSIRNGRPHSGIDLVTLPTPGPLVAASTGTVHHAGGGYGTYGISVILNHGGGIWSVYGHMSSLAPGIKEGVKVTIGQKLGIEGSTGNSSGSHVHFEIDKGPKPGKFIDPVKFMRSKGVEFDGKATPQGGAAAKPKPGTAQQVADRSTGQGVAGRPAVANPDSGGSFQMPSPKGFPRKNSKHTKPMPVPAKIKKYYLAAAKKYKVHWTLLAGVGMEETHHGKYAKRTSSAGAGGLMQFIASTWASMGVDGDGDGKADRYNDADSVHSAANYLTKMGARKGPDGVLKAINGYNPGAAAKKGDPRSSWYVGDVLYYAAAYGGGAIPVGDDAGEGECETVPVSDTLDPDRCADGVLTKLTPAQRAGQLLMVGVQPGQSPASVGKLIKSRHVGSVIYLGGWNGVTGVAATSKRLQSYAPKDHRLMVAADQEGGKVWQIRDPQHKSAPSAVEQGRASAAQRTKYGKDIGVMLKKAGVNLNLAPVADTVPASIGKKNGPIGQHDRQYGSTPAVVAAAVPDVVKGIQSADVATTIKHFPGIGRIRENTDFSTTGIEDTAATESDPHLKPFAAGIKAGADMVMVSSARYPKLDQANPAVFSRPIITNLLRSKMKYQGVVVTDDVAAAATRGVPAGQRATRFVAAGGDLILTGRASEAPGMLNALTAKANSDKAFKKQLDTAAKRVLVLKAQQGLLECGPAESGGPAVGTAAAKKVIKTAQAESGDKYKLGANGPDVWDCSSLTLHAYKSVGINLPRSAQAQRDWLAGGNGTKVPLGQEKPGDLVFWNSYNGPKKIGHVAIAVDTKKHTSIEARDPKHGVGSWDYTRAKKHTIYEIWRPKTGKSS